jgi:hypothetical protein
MTAANAPPLTVTEDVLAELATAAYRVALRHGLRAPFIDVELDLWRELRATVDSSARRRKEPAGRIVP